MNRDQLREAATGIFRTLHAELLKRGIFSTEQMIHEHDKYLIVASSPRGCNALGVKQSIIVLYS